MVSPVSVVSRAALPGSRLLLIRVLLAAALTLPGCSGGSSGWAANSPVQGSLVQGSLVQVSPVPVRPLAHGVFVAGPEAPEDAVTDAQLDAYSAAVGVPGVAGGPGLAYVYLSNNWFRSRHFPVQVVRRVQARGAAPVVRLMLRSSDEAATGPDGSYTDAGYTLAELAGGALDADLTVWAREAARLPGPLYVEYGTEVNGDWFGWNARWNGHERGAALFVRAYRHLVGVVRQAGASNVRWVFHVAAQDDPQTDGPQTDGSQTDGRPGWNRLEAYYPGGDVISVLGVSAYGAQTPQDTDIRSLRSQLDAVLPRLGALAPGKPVLLLEFGSAAGASVTPEAWAGAALNDLTSGRWPQLRGFSWWNSAWQNDDQAAHDTEMRVERQPLLAAVFRRYLGHTSLGTGSVTSTLDLRP